MLDLFRQSFHLYGLLIGLGMVAALEVSLRLARFRYIKEELVRELFWWVIIFGVLGARIYHVVDYWERFYRDNLIQVFYIWNGGLGIWGGIAGGMLGIMLFWWLKGEGSPLRRFFAWKGISPLRYAPVEMTKQVESGFAQDDKGVRSGIGQDDKGVRSKISRDDMGESFLGLLDVVVIGLPLAQTIGRLGNFFNQELYGKETSLPWGLLIDGKYHHPLFAYEGVLNLILFGMLWKLRNKQGGLITGGYLIGYGLIRLVLEELRPEEIVWKVGGIPMAIIWSVVAIVLGVAVTCRRK